MGRHLDERIVLRAPWLFRLSLRLVQAMPPGSSIRRRSLKWAFARGFEALSRGDHAVPLVFFDTSAEFEVVGERLRALGFAERYRGHEEIRRFSEQWRVEWSDVQQVPDLMIDRGDRVIVRVTVTTQGARSGAETTQTVGYVYDLGDGVAVRGAFYWEWFDCCAAMGMDENAQAPVSPVT